MGLCNKNKGEIYAKKEESISVVEGGKRGSKGVYSRAAEEGVHPTIKVTTDSTGILYGKEGWKEKDGVGL